MSNVNEVLLVELEANIRSKDVASFLSQMLILAEQVANTDSSGPDAMETIAELEAFLELGGEGLPIAKRFTNILGAVESLHERLGDLENISKSLSELEKHVGISKPSGNFEDRLEAICTWTNDGKGVAFARLELADIIEGIVSSNDDTDAIRKIKNLVRGITQRKGLGLKIDFLWEVNCVR